MRWKGLNSVARPDRADRDPTMEAPAAADHRMGLQPT